MRSLPARRVYTSNDSVLAIPVTPGGGFPFGTPRTLFSVIVKSGVGSGFVVAD